MLTAQQLVQHFQNAHVATAVSTIDLAGTRTVRQGRQLVHGVAVAVDYLEQAVLNAAALGRLTVATIAQGMTAIETLAKVGAAGHKAVKLDQRWRKIYRRGLRNVYVMNSNGNIALRQVQTYPCHFCGLIIPETLVEVEHRQPQAHPWLATLKCLHMLGSNYTVAPGKGNKTGQLAALVALGANPTRQAVDAKNLTLTKPDKRNNAPFLQFEAYLPEDHPYKEDRYTITAAGETFLSCALSFWGVAGMQSRCLNNVLNLVPSCRHCNNGVGMKHHKVYARAV